MTLTRNQILSSKDLPTQVVDTPEWGGSVIVKTLPASERDRFEDSITKTKGDSVEVNMKNLRAKLCALCVVDGNGKRIFADSDVVELGGKSGKVLDRIFAAAQELNGLGKDDITDLVKNSEPAPDEDSLSG